METDSGNNLEVRRVESEGVGAIGEGHEEVDIIS